MILKQKRVKYYKQLKYLYEMQLTH